MAPDIEAGGGGCRVLVLNSQEEVRDFRERGAETELSHKEAMRSKACGPGFPNRAAANTDSVSTV